MPFVHQIQGFELSLQGREHVLNDGLRVTKKYLWTNEAFICWKACASREGERVIGAFHGELLVSKHRLKVHNEF